MTAFYRHCIRPLLFTRDSEEIHNRARCPLHCSAYIQV